MKRLILLSYLACISHAYAAIQSVEDYIRLKGPDTPFTCMTIRITNISDQPITIMSFLQNQPNEVAPEQSLEPRGVAKLDAGASIITKVDRGRAMPRGNYAYRLYAYQGTEENLTKLNASMVLSVERIDSGLCAFLKENGQSIAYEPLRMKYNMSKLQIAGIVAAGFAALVVAAGVGGYYAGMHRPVRAKALGESDRYNEDYKSELQEAFEVLDTNPRFGGETFAQFALGKETVEIPLEGGGIFVMDEEEFDDIHPYWQRAKNIDKALYNYEYDIAHQKRIGKLKTKFDFSKKQSRW